MSGVVVDRQFRNCIPLFLYVFIYNHIIMLEKLNVIVF